VLCNLFSSKLILLGGVGTLGSIINLTLSVKGVDQFFGLTLTKLLVDSCPLRIPDPHFMDKLQLTPSCDCWFGP
jgi:hypothetical protein